jgi:para-nitrobenzyl esterase
MKTILSLLAVASLGGTAAAQPIVDAPAGRVSGTTDGDIHVFKGVPYALPPVANRRWTAPVAMPRWPGVRPAAEFGPACIQPTSKAGSIYSPTTPLPTSEDCLSLNIWAPKGARKAPVMVWIHGGALVGGSSREDLYDGRRLAERGVIVVSINYRLGVLGWLAHPALSAENGRKLSGNYGLLDQIAALQWIRRNVAAFGGDANNVTIAGESAGALSVTYLMTAPSARQLFHRAIAQSAYMVTMPELRRTAYGLPSGEAAGQALATTLKAPDVVSLRRLDAQQLTDGAALAGFQPWGMIDGVILPEQLVAAFDGGRQARVPILTGFNQGEIRSLRMLAPPPPKDAATYETLIRERYSDLSDPFLRLYPAAEYRESILATTRDALYGWTAERLARSQAALGLNSYLYLFDHGYPDMDAAGLHAFHASELPYMFGTLRRTGPNWPRIPDTARETALSDAMVGYWTGFAKSGRPRAASAPAWPEFKADRIVMHFSGTPRARPDLLAGMFELNEEVVRRRRAAGTAPWNWNVGIVANGLDPAKSR